MYDILTGPLDKVKLYSGGQCYNLTKAKLIGVGHSPNKKTSLSAKITIEGTLEKIETGMVPVKAGKHSYVVQPVSLKEGLLEIDNRSIRCYSEKIDIQQVVHHKEDGFKYVSNVPNPHCTLYLEIPVGLNFSNNFTPVEEVKKVKIEINRYMLMDFDE
jgi:hypothetical protein